MIDSEICSSTEESLKTLWIHTYTHTHSGILVRKKSKILPFAVTWVDLELILSEGSQKKTITI